MGTRTSFAGGGRLWLCLVLLGATICPAMASSWRVTNGDWFEGINWTGGVPGRNSLADISNGGTAAIYSGAVHVWIISVGAGTVVLGETGTVEADTEAVGALGAGTFTQTGGTHTVWTEMYMGRGTGGVGTYELSGSGSFLGYQLFLGDRGTGRFIQTGGTNTLSHLVRLGGDPTGVGIYELSGAGSLSAASVWVGNHGTGTFTQTGGTSTVIGNIYLGFSSGGEGEYGISGGSLAVGEVFVGSAGQGRFSITGAGAQITVSQAFAFGEDSAFSAVAGSTIHMAGAGFTNQNTDPADLTGLANLTLIFEGGTDSDDFEVAGEDRGAALTGWDANFELYKLQLGTGIPVQCGRIRLVDSYDNQSDGGTANEVLYADWLVMNAGASWCGPP